MSSSNAVIDFLGPLLIGVVCNAIVFGICCMQLFSYFTAGFNDSPKLRILIGWVYAVDVFQLWQSVDTLWYYTVANFDDPTVLTTGPWVYASLPIFGSLAIVPIQIFMASRIMRFAQSKILFFFLCVLSLAQAALACSAATLGMINPAVSNHINIIPVADAWLGVALFCDTTITGLLLYYLFRSRTGFQKTDSIIMRICLTTMEAAVPVSILCAGDLIALTKNPRSNWHYMFALPVGRLYTNTLMVTLNDRKNLRSQMEQSIANGISLGNFASSSSSNNKHRSVFSAATARPNPKLSLKPPVHISISQDVETRLDGLRTPTPRSVSFPSPVSPSFPSSHRRLGDDVDREGDQDSEVSMGYTGSRSYSTEKETELQSPVTPVTPVGVAFLDLHAAGQKESEAFLNVDSKASLH